MSAFDGGPWMRVYRMVACDTMILCARTPSPNLFLFFHSFSVVHIVYSLDQPLLDGLMFLVARIPTRKVGTCPKVAGTEKLPRRTSYLEPMYKAASLKAEFS